MTARIISNVDSNFFSFSYGTNAKASIFRTPVRNQQLIGLPFKQRLDFKVLCSIKERERKNAEEKLRMAGGVPVEGELKEKESHEKVKFDWDWPPWKNLPQRYKLIGTTSLAFVVCNMDKVICVMWN